MKTPLCGMLTLAAIYFTAQTTTPPTGKVGINTTTPTETLDVKGKVRIQELYTDNQQTGTNNNANFNATNVVTADDNGVLGKKSLSSIIAAQTPNFPWKKVGTENENAVPASGLKIYSKYAVGIGDYSATNSSVGSSFEIKGGGTTQLGLINGTSKWDISTEDKSLTFTKRAPENGRIFSLTDKAIIYLGNTLLSQDGNGAKLILDGGMGTIGIGKNSTDYDLDVNGYTRISQLPTSNDYAKYYTTENGTRVQKTKTDKYVPAKMVVVDADGVLGKQDFPTIPTIPTIPTEPWRQLGGTDEATTNTQNIYQNGKVGIGNYASTSSFDSDFEVNSSRNGYHVGIANGADTKWNLSAESGNEKAFTITKRHPNNQGRLLSLDKDAKLYLGNTLLNTSGSGAKILVDGGQGKVAIGKNSASYTLDVNGDTGIKGQLNLIDSSNDNNKFLTYTEGTQLLFDKKITVPTLNVTQTGVMASLTNVGKLYLGSGLTKPSGHTLSTANAKILLDGQDGKVAIGKNSADYNLDVVGDAKISGLPDKGASDTVKMVVVDNSGVLKKADIPTGGGSGNGVTKHDSSSTPQCNADNAGTIHYKEGVTVNGQSTSVMGFCMKTADSKYRWFYIFGGAGTTTGSKEDAPTFGAGL